MWKVHRFVPASVKLLWSSRSLSLMCRIDRFSFSAPLNISRIETRVSVYTWWLTEGSFFACLYQNVCVCVPVCVWLRLFLVFWVLIGLWHIYTVRREGLPSIHISPVSRACSVLSGQGINVTITAYAIHPSVGCLFCVISWVAILESPSHYFTLLIVIVKLAAIANPFLIRHTSREVTSPGWGCVKTLV